MKNRRFLALGLGLVLAGTLAFADAALAQCCGGYGPRWSDYQGAGWRGGGPGYRNCAYGGYGYCAPGSGYYGRGPRGKGPCWRDYNNSAYLQTTTPQTIR